MKVTGMSGAALVAMLSVGLAACGGGGGKGGAGSPQPSPPPPSGTSPSPSPAPSPSPSPSPTPTYSIGGTATGLVGSALVIANNGGDPLTLTDSADFTFATELADNESYAVTIVSQPSNPDRVCTLDNATGTVAGADVTSVVITCTGPLTLVSSAPVAGDQQVSRVVQPLLAFSADIDEATAATAFTLESEHRTETFTVNVTGDSVTLVPQATLLPLTDYTLTISDTLRGTADERPLASETLTFRTRDGLWSDAQPLGAGLDARVANAPDGRAWVVWSRPMGAAYEIVADRYDPATGWALDPQVLGAGSGAVVAMDATGDATVAWLNASGDIDARRHDADLDEWSDPETVSGPGDNVSSLDIAVDSQGRVLLMWQQDDAGVPSIASAYFDGSGWNAPLFAEQDDILAYSPTARFLPDGTAIAAWRQFDDGASHDIAVSRFDATSGWGPVEILTPTFGDTYSVSLAVDPDGNVMAVWGQSETFEEDIAASYYTPSGGWQEPVLIESQPGNAASPRVEFAPDGTAIVVWKQGVSTSSGNTARVYQNRFTPGEGWGTEAEISTVGSANYPRIVIDGNGNAISTWWVLDLSVSFDAYSIWANRYTPENGWTTAEKIHDVGALIGTNAPRIAIDASGNAIAVWHSTTAGGVSASRFE